MTKKDSVDDAVAAFGPGCTLAARGAYFKKYGEKAFLEESAKWQSDPRKLVAGVRPEAYGAADKDNHDHEDNPWATNDTARIYSCLKSLPTAACVRMAKAVGKRLDGTKLGG